jgi:hypothetical protein
VAAGVYPEIQFVIYEPGDSDNTGWLVRVKQHRTEVFSREYPSKQAAIDAMEDLWEDIEEATMALRRAWANKNQGEGTQKMEQYLRDEVDNLSGLKFFHLGDILSITGDYLVSPRGMTGVYEIMEWMTGQQLSSMAPLFLKASCQEALLERYPHLAGVDCSGLDKDTVDAHVEKLTRIYGKYLPVARMNNK